MRSLQLTLGSPMILLDDQENEYHVFFSKRVESFFRKVQNSTMREMENGGLLLGGLNGNEIIIDFVTWASKNDVRKRYKFIRKDYRHIKVWKYLNEKSCRKIGSLGEWHSHPEAVPYPSGIDLREWNKKKNVKEIPCLFLIIGSKEIYLEMRL